MNKKMYDLKHWCAVNDFLEILTKAVMIPPSWVKFIDMAVGTVIPLRVLPLLWIPLATSMNSVFDDNACPPWYNAHLSMDSYLIDRWQSHFAFKIDRSP
jgi:hypothetical protein